MIEFGKLFISFGIFLLIVGGIFLLLGKATGLPKLPGDIFIKNGNFTFYFPVVTSIVISVVLTVILNIFFRR